MDPELAQRFGVAYVHLVAFAIDIDRIHEATQDDPDGVWPFGWEVFLSEIHMLGMFDPAVPEERELVVTVCEGIMQLPKDSLAFGAQLPFCLYDAITRGEWPEEDRSVFRSWKDGPDELTEALKPLWVDANVEANDLALACTEVVMHPAISPPSRQALDAMLEVY